MARGVDLASGLGSDMERRVGRTVQKEVEQRGQRGKHEGKRDRKSGVIWNVVSERGYNISRLWEDWIMETLEGGRFYSTGNQKLFFSGF